MQNKLFVRVYENYTQFDRVCVYSGCVMISEEKAFLPLQDYFVNALAHVPSDR